MVVLAAALAIMVVTQATDRLIVTGKVREVGGGLRGASQALLVADDRSEVVLHGASEADEEELRRLAGVRVKVFGVKTDPRSVKVERYEIVDVGGGVVPRIGHVALLELGGKPRLIFVSEDGKAE